MADAKISPETGSEPETDSSWPPELMEKSLFIFDLKSGLRKKCIDIVAPGSAFDKFILFMIIANSIVMGELTKVGCK